MEKAYISVEGRDRLVAELQTLRSVERPKVVDEVAAAAAQGDRSENAEYIYGKKRLREIDRRCRWLSKRLEILVAVDLNAERNETRCFFGARVSVEDDDGTDAHYVIVGEDEIDLKRGHISYRSPLGRALLGKEPGDTVEVQTPSGLRCYSINEVAYGIKTTEDGNKG